MVDQLGKIRTNSEDRRKAKQVVTEDRTTWAVNAFMPYMTPGPDGIYSVYLQKEFDITIKYLTEAFRSSLAIGHTPILWRD